MAQQHMLSSIVQPPTACPSGSFGLRRDRVGRKHAGAGKRYLVRAVADVAASGGYENVFGSRREASTQQAIVEAIPQPLRLVAAAATVGAAGAAGYIAGGAAPENVQPVAQIASAAVLGAGSAVAVKKFAEQHQSLAALELHNLAVGLGDAQAIRPEDVRHIALKCVCRSCCYVGFALIVIV
jgi:hypothetical protein